MSWKDYFLYKKRKKMIKMQKNLVTCSGNNFFREIDCYDEQIFTYTYCN